MVCIRRDQEEKLPTESNKQKRVESVGIHYLNREISHLDYMNESEFDRSIWLLNHQKIIHVNFLEKILINKL
jgi:hypothetical protein